MWLHGSLQETWRCDRATSCTQVLIPGDECFPLIGWLLCGGNLRTFATDHITNSFFAVCGIFSHAFTKVAGNWQESGDAVAGFGSSQERNSCVKDTF